MATATQMLPTPANPLPAFRVWCGEVNAILRRRGRYEVPEQYQADELWMMYDSEFGHGLTPNEAVAKMALADEKFKADRRNGC